MSELKRSRIKFFCHNRRAGVSIMFAIVLPLLLATFSLGIDGSRFLIKRARLADALSQGSFAVASTNTNLTTPHEKTEGKELVRNYINYYLPGDLIDESTLNVQAVLEKDPDDSTVINKVDYIATAKIIAHPIFDGLSNALPGFSKDILISADNNNGIVRKGIEYESVESDIALAIDFSASILENSSDGKSHLAILRTVVNDLISEIVKEKSKTKIALIPFEFGIPVKLDEKNEADGDRIGCVFPYKLNSSYNIDFAFWANKRIDWRMSGIYSYDLKVIQGYMDLKRYEYYKDIVGKSSLGASYTKFCKINSSYDAAISSGSINSNPLSCEAVESVSVFKNGTEISSNMNIIQNYYYPYLVQAFGGHLFPSLTVIDVNGTVNPDFLFNENRMKKFEVPFASNTKGNMFSTYCASGFNFEQRDIKTDVLTIPDGYYPFSDNDNYYSTYLKDVRQNAYVISLTNNRTAVDAFNKMYPTDSSSTDVTNGLLYAAHEVAKGTNPRKIIIVISDGQVNGLIDEIQQTFFDSKVCQKIIDGIVKYSPGTKEARIYYVSVTNDMLRLNNWKDKCVGEDGGFVATDYSSLKNAIQDIVGSTSSGGLNFVNKSESTAP